MVTNTGNPVLLQGIPTMQEGLIIVSGFSFQDNSIMKFFFPKFGLWTL